MDTDRVLNEIRSERQRQNEKFGTLRYPDGTGRRGDIEEALRLKAICKANGPAEDNWRDILAEEKGEAFAETHPGLLRAELVQIAAVAVAWIEDIDQRGHTAADLCPTPETHNWGCACTTATA